MPGASECGEAHRGSLLAYDVLITKADASTVEVKVTKDFTVAPAEAGDNESGETGADAETGAESPDGTSGK